MKKSIRRTLFVITDILVIVFVFLGVYTVAEYRPEAIESVEFVKPSGLTTKSDLSTKYTQQEPITITSWNIGFAGLGQGQDFFMDGGKSVRPENKEIIQTNLTGIVKTVKSNPSDIWLFQEIDENSKRTYRINQKEFLAKETNMGSSLAYNYECFFVPFPIPMIGKVMSGIGTYSQYELHNLERIQLPVPFSWPARMANMKRCLLVSRVSLGEGNPELVLVNVHLEAYDNGEGKIKQTEMLVEVIESEYAKGNYVIAGGDFNQLFPGFTHISYSEDDDIWIPGNLEPSNLPTQEWQLVTGDNAPTCRSLHAPLEESKKDSWPYYVIDGFIVSPNISVQTVSVLDEEFTYSDHNPVTIDVVLH